jgi:hypothetical protein
MIRLSIKRKIIGIALVLIVLMAVTALISLALVVQVSHHLEDLTNGYVPAYGALARANVSHARARSGVAPNDHPENAINGGRRTIHRRPKEL